MPFAVATLADRLVAAPHPDWDVADEPVERSSTGALRNEGRKHLRHIPMRCIRPLHTNESDAVGAGVRGMTQAPRA